MMKTTITISRQLGCGGSYIGQLIAKRLGIKYVDREVLRLAAKEFGCDEEDVAARQERVASFWERVFSGLSFWTPDGPYTPPPLRNFSDRELFDKQTEILKRIAARHDCVVIGWAGVFVLPRHHGSFSVFCHAPEPFRVRRTMEVYKARTKEEARAMIEESDDMRTRYFAEMTGHDWTEARNYNLAVDTSIMPLEQTAELIIELAKRKQSAD
jgi:cytidylate kinase